MAADSSSLIIALVLAALWVLVLWKRRRQRQPGHPTSHRSFSASSNRARPTIVRSVATHAPLQDRPHQPA